MSAILSLHCLRIAYRPYSQCDYWSNLWNNASWQRYFKQPAVNTDQQRLHWISWTLLRTTDRFCTGCSFWGGFNVFFLFNSSRKTKSEMWKTAASPASDAQVCPDFLQTLISVYDLLNPSDPLPLPCCSFYQPLSLWSPSGSAVRAAMRVGLRPNFGKQETSGNTGKRSCFRHLIRARCTDCVRARRRRGRIRGSVWRSDSHSHQQVRGHRSSQKKKGKGWGGGVIKKKWGGDGWEESRMFSFLRCLGRDEQAGCHGSRTLQ